MSLSLVRCLFHGTELLPALEAVRSQCVHIPPEAGEYKNKVVELYKYAPMGSAVCFPVEAVVFWALSTASILYSVGELNASERPAVYVYGDDIIVETRYAETLKEFLPKYGLLVNSDKSYDRGPFRESCGYDCFKGEIVTPLKVRKLWPTDRIASAEELASYSEYSNSLNELGYFEASEYLAQLQGIRSLSRLPKNSRYGTGIRRDDFYLESRYCSKLHRPEVKVTTLVNKTRVSRLSGRHRMLANLTGNLRQSYDVPHASNMKLRWTGYFEPTTKEPNWVSKLFPGMAVARAKFTKNRVSRLQA